MIKSYILIPILLPSIILYPRYVQRMANSYDFQIPKYYNLKLQILKRIKDLRM